MTKIILLDSVLSSPRGYCKRNSNSWSEFKSMSAGDAFLRIWNLLDWRIAIVIAQQQLQFQQQNLGLDLVIAGNHHHPN